MPWLLQDVVMEPQPGSPLFSPPSTALWDNARAGTPSEEMAAPDEPKEEGTELEPARKSTSSSSSSSSSSSASSADIPCHIDVVELINPLAAALPEDEHGAVVKTAHSATLEDERAAPAVHSAEAKPADGAMTKDVQAAPAVHSAEAKPDDWVTWPDPPPPAVDDSFASSDGRGAARPEAPKVQTVSPTSLGAAGSNNGYDPGRIPASVFQHRTSVSQADWSMASNESLFSIQGASDLYPGSRSHFDFFYDEAMAEADSRLPSLAEGAEPGDAPESKEFAAAPRSAEPAASTGCGNDAKRAAVFRSHESGSGSSSSNFSFAFPINHLHADWRRRRRGRRTSSTPRCTSRWRRSANSRRRRRRRSSSSSSPPCRPSWR
ncbi:uncharacterized protein [Zea mays]|nr:uncharacterized protein LOC100501160 isoform X3 [Zea mays]|eukprot:XP_008673315.1 uncharacterized protein LOC100501160 isoform X3 [Zea mays]